MRGAALKLGQMLSIQGMFRALCGVVVGGWGMIMLWVLDGSGLLFVCQEFGPRIEKGLECVLYVILAT
jgi:hypothetical protein